MLKAKQQRFLNQKKSRLLVFILLLLLPFLAQAQGDLLITPHRVVLEGNKQIE
jgi:P pilus assembly chaperone PapD